MDIDMYQGISHEDVQRIKELYPINTDGHLRRVRRLLKYALPGNAAWRILENQYGYDGDYTAADAGEPPQGARW